jgi:hypothetical protein
MVTGCSTLIKDLSRHKLEFTLVGLAHIGSPRRSVSRANFSLVNLSDEEQTETYVGWPLYRRYGCTGTGIWRLGRC